MTDQRLESFKHATAARGALWWIAWICLLASGAFWLSLYAAVLAPPTLLSRQTIASITMGIVYTLVLPLLCSMLVPTTPAGQLLQRTQWATIGFWVIGAATVFLSWHAWTMLTLWWSAQPIVEESGQAAYLSIASIIGFVLIPAAAWVQVSPERWVAEIDQWRQVRRIERMAQLEDAAYKAMIARTRAILNAELSGEASERFPELVGLLLASERVTRQALSNIADSFIDMYGVELRLGMEPDSDLAARYRQMAQQLAQTSDQLPLIDVTPRDEPRESSRALERSPAAHVDSRLQSSNAREDESVRVSQSQSESDSSRVILRERLPAPFTAQNIADVMQWSDKRSAQRLIRMWLDNGWIEEVRLGRYNFTESEA